MPMGASERDQAATTTATGAAGVDDRPINWETVHVTPLTAERELALITTSRCFILHASTGFGTAAQQSSLHATATGVDDLHASDTATTDGGGGASTTLSPYDNTTGGAASTPDVTANPSLSTAPVSLTKEEERSATHGSGVSSLHPPFDPFGTYRRVRVIHNTASCLVRCTAEVGPALLQSFTSGLPDTSNNTTGIPTSAVSAVPPLVATTAALPSACQPVRQRVAEQSTSSFMQTSFRSTADGAARQSSPLALPPLLPLTSHGGTATTASGGTSSRPAGGPGSPAASPQLPELASAYARSAQRRVSKASSRGSHTSSSMLPENVVFADPLEIIAEDAITFVDIDFAAHVSVRGRGPVQFVNCGFSRRTVAQLCQQFVPHPFPSDTGSSGKGDGEEGRRYTDAKGTLLSDIVQMVAPDVNATGVDSSENDSGQLSGWADPAAVEGGGSPAPPEDHTSPHGSKPAGRSSPLRVTGDSCGGNSGVFGLGTGFALPTTMRAMGVRRRSSQSPTATDSRRGEVRASAAGATASKAAPSFADTMSAMPDGAATSALDVHGAALCVLYQCDLTGGCGGASLVCRDASRLHVTDSTFDGPSITWAAVEVRDQAEARVQYCNVQHVMGVGVLVTDHGSATVDSSVIECCGVAGVVATDNAKVSLFNTGVVAPASGVCVSLSGSAEAEMRGCGCTARFPLPRRATGLMFVEYLQSLGAFRATKTTETTTPSQDSIASSPEDPLLQHVLQADLESLLGLWLLHIGAADEAFPTSSQSLVLCDRAVAVVEECEFACAMRLPGSSLSSSSPSASPNAADATTLEENPSSSGSHAYRSDGTVTSLTGLPPAATVLSVSDANLSATNSRGLGSSTAHLLGGNTSAVHAGAFLLPTTSTTRRLAAAVEEAGMRRSSTHVAPRFTAADLGGASGGSGSGSSDEAAPLPSGVIRTTTRRPTTTTATTNAAATASPLLSAGGRSTGPPSSLLPVQVRRVVAGMLSSYVMAREVFGEYLSEKRRAHAAARRLPDTAASPLEESKKTVADPRRPSGVEKTRTELFLSFEALTEVEDKDGDDPRAMRLHSTNTTGTSRRLSNLSTAAMESLQESLQQLGCLSVLMAPNGGVYHTVVSHQAWLVLTSSVLSLALPPQLMVTLPGALASAAGYFFGITSAFSSTIRTTAAPFVATVLDYCEPSTSTQAAPKDDNRERMGHAAPSGSQHQEDEHQQQRVSEFCTIVTQSNVVKYECVSTVTSQGYMGQSVRQMPKTTTTAAASGAQRPESRHANGEHRTTTTTTISAATAHHSGRGSRGVTDDDDDDDDYAETVESPTVRSILGGSYSNSLKQRKGPAVEGDAAKPAGSRTEAIPPKKSASLPPRPFSASASAAQHPHMLPPPPLLPQQSSRPPLQRSADDNTSSSSAVDFNTAAWGLVLVTPPTTHHSDAMMKAVHGQSEHWRRVELATASSPTATHDGSSDASCAATPPQRTSASEMQTSQVVRPGNTFLNMANEAELLSVTHPEHICTSFANFAQVMELPAAQAYPATSARYDVSPLSLAPTSSPPHHDVPIAVPATGTSAASTETGDGARPLLDVGRNATAVESSNSSSPGVPHGTLPSSLFSEREGNRLHVNADVQRQMLLHDVDAPPFLVAAVREDVAAAAGAGSSGGYTPHNLPPSTASGLRRSPDRARTDVNRATSTTSQHSNQPSPLLAPDTTTTAQATSQGMQASGGGTANHTHLFVNRHDAQRSGPADSASPANTVATADAAATFPSTSLQGLPGRAVQPPSPLELSIVDIESNDSAWSSNTSSSNDGSCEDSDNASSAGSSDTEDVRSDSTHAQSSNHPPPWPHRPSKWTLLRRPSTDNVESSTDAGAEGTQGRPRTDSKEESVAAAPASVTRADSDYDADLTNHGSDVASTAPSSASGSHLRQSPERQRKTAEEAKTTVAQTGNKNSCDHWSQLTSATAAATAGLPPLSAAVSKSATQPHSHVPLPEFQLSPSNPELLVSSAAARTVDYEPTSPTSSMSTPSSSPPSSKTHSTGSVSTSSAASYSSEPRHHNHARHRRRRSTTHAMPHTQPSSGTSSPPECPLSRNTRSRSSSRNLVEHTHPATDEGSEVDNTTNNRSRKTSNEQVSGAGATPNVEAVPVALKVALQRMAQLEEQVEQMQRRMDVQETQMTAATAHAALPPLSSSQPEMFVLETEPSLLALPPTVKSAADTAEHTQGSSKDSRPARSSSDRSSFSGGKRHSASTSHHTPVQPTQTAAGESSIVLDDSAKPSADSPPRPTPQPSTSSLSEKVDGAMRPRAPAVTLEEAGTVLAASTPTMAKNTKENNTGSNNSGVAGNGNDAMPANGVEQRTERLPISSPLPLPLLPETDSPQLATATAGPLLTPSPPLSSPPTAAQNPPVRVHRRRPSATTLELLVSAAQHSLLGTTPNTNVYDSVASGAIEGVNHAECNTSLNVQQQLQQQQVEAEAAAAAAYDAEEDRRWRETLLRRLRPAHGIDTPTRWRDRLPFSTASTSNTVVGWPMLSGGLHDYAPPAVAEWEEAVREGSDSFDDNDDYSAEAGSFRSPRQGSATVAYEPWRTTVATGTRFAHQPPPHPYAVSAQSPDAGLPPRWRDLPPPLQLLSTPSGTSTVSSGTTSSAELLPHARRPHRPSSCPVPYIESANSSQLSPVVLYPPVASPAALTTLTSSGTYGQNTYAAPAGLYLSGRRRSIHLRTAPPSAPSLTTTAATTPSPPRPPYPGFSPIAHLHEDNLHDQHARAAWNAVVAQELTQSRERRRLSSPRQSAQVARLYTEPMRLRMHRAAAHAQPTREQLYRLHGCTFTPKINHGRGAAKRRAVSRQRTANGTVQRGSSHNEDASSESLRNSPSALPPPTATTTKSCDEATTNTSVNSVRLFLNPSHRLPPS